MTEDRVGFLSNLASSLSLLNETHKVLRSYYLMRCKELTKGYGLPTKHFSTIARCPHCCLEWSRDKEVKVKPIKLTKSQRKKIKSQKETEHNKNIVKKKKDLLRSNEMVQVCTFCKQSTTTKLIKPKKEYNIQTTPKEINILKENNQKKKEVLKKAKKKADSKMSEIKKSAAVVNVYSNAFDVFSLRNEKNNLSSSIKEPIKVINNSKKKKDKFAGLCQKAVLASAKLKQQKEPQTQLQKSQNRLNLFLKPSSG